MSLSLSFRIIIKIFLVIQFSLLVFRQVIDFAGIQWLMILANAVAIIITLCAFFGYLTLYLVFQALLIGYNVFVICVYARIVHLAPSSTMITAQGDHNFYHTNAQEGASDEDYNSLTSTTTTAHYSPSLPSIQLLSFDSNSRSFWYVIVSNHIQELQSLSNLSPSSSLQQRLALHASSGTASAASSTTLDESLVDVCVQYIEIAIASLHILLSLLGVGLILLKFKLQRDKLNRCNDKTTPPLPPYTIR